MKEHGIEYRKYVIGGVAVLIVTIYIIRLFTLQLMSDDYKKNADSNAFLKKIDYPSRGIITARNGELMVYNQPAYDIMVVINEAKHHLDTVELCQTLDITREDFDARMASIKDRSKNPGYSPFEESWLFAFHTAGVHEPVVGRGVQHVSGEDIPFPWLLCAEAKYPPV